MVNAHLLSLNKRECLVVDLIIPLEKIKIVNNIKVILKAHCFDFIIGEGTAIELLQDFSEKLCWVIENKMILPLECICKANLGLQAVKELVESLFDSENYFDKKNFCSHQSYSLFSYKNKRATWLYNDIYGNIVLEVSPWFDVLEAKNEKAYKNWIKNYKPILRRIIKPELANIWLEQIRALLCTVRINSALPPE